MSQDHICTYCGRRGHRANRCPARVLGVVGAVLRALKRLVCAVVGCRPVLLHTVRGYRDGQVHGVWECSRCALVWRA